MDNLSTFLENVLKLAPIQVKQIQEDYKDRFDQLDAGIVSWQNEKKYLEMLIQSLKEETNRNPKFEMITSNSSHICFLFQSIISNKFI